MCPFCDIRAALDRGRTVVPLADAVPGDVVRVWDDAMAVVPLDPAVPHIPEGGPGHLMVIPRAHRPHAASDPEVTAVTMRRLAELLADLGWHANIAINEGPLAGQTVFHLHAHVIWRQAGDGIHMPWTRRYLTQDQLTALAGRMEDYQHQRAHLPTYAEAAQRGTISPLGMTGRPHAAVVGLDQAPGALLDRAPRVTLAAARKDLAGLIGAAAATGPVVLTRYGKDVAAVVAVAELALLDV